MEQKRISVKLKDPNPLFAKWITEWRDEAKEKNWKTQYNLSTALSSLKKYPLPLESAKDCKILKGFGDKICSMLEKKLIEHQLNNSGENQTLSTANQPVLIDISDDELPAKKPRTSAEKPYVPKPGSGGYAILLSLYKKSMEVDYPGFLTKADLIKEAKNYSDKSFTKPDPGSRYTAWSSMKTLLTKELVIKKSNPAKFSLSDTGADLAFHLHNTIENMEEKEKNINTALSVNSASKNAVPILNLTTSSSKSLTTKSSCSSNSLKKHASSSSTKSLKKINSCSSTASTIEEDIIFEPDKFDIILMVDKCETIGKSETSKDPLIFDLNKLSIVYEVRDLKVGDFTWICRDRITKQELVLPYIIERKRMDDFAASIKDGRYHEQKFRLKRCGIKSITYLIESYGKNNVHVGLPLSTLYQAATNTAIQDGFCIKFTNNLRGTAEYLGCFSKILIKKFKSKTVMSCPKENLPEDFSINDDLVPLLRFKEFNESSVKNKKIRIKDLFVKSLIQIKGLSVDRALAIVEKYETPMLLHQAYLENAGSSGEKLLSNIQFGDRKKNIGPVLSKTVYQLFTSKIF